MAKQTDFVLAVAGMMSCGVIALQNPHAWEVPTLIGFVFFGCAIMAGQKLGR